LQAIPFAFIKKETQNIACKSELYSNILLFSSYKNYNLDIIFIFVDKFKEIYYNNNVS